MSDTREKLSTMTVSLHWTVGLLMIGMVLFGLYIGSVHCGDGDDACKATHLSQINLHKSIGLMVLVFASWRLLRRLAIGMPPHVGVYAAWENMLSAATHGLLLLASLALPLSGIAYSAASGYPVNFFGLPVIPKLMERDKELAHNIHEVHELLGYTLLALLALHIAGALKHAVLDGDGTMKRMLGARVEPVGKDYA
jgi:cytochrome b561